MDKTKIAQANLLVAIDGSRVVHLIGVASASSVPIVKVDGSGQRSGLRNEAPAFVGTIVKAVAGQVFAWKNATYISVRHNCVVVVLLVFNSVHHVVDEIRLWFAVVHDRRLVLGRTSDN